eukprot:COSAG04_NODE_7152_length_1179_cov_7.729630_1_plen_106_part_00
MDAQRLALERDELRLQVQNLSAQLASLSMVGTSAAAQPNLAGPSQLSEAFYLERERAAERERQVERERQAERERLERAERSELRLMAMLCVGAVALAAASVSRAR